MSHVDEGTLHALLDGALAAADPAGAQRVELHLAACPDCRARLDEAARLRDEAGALLASAQPRVVDTPSFEDIRARAATLGTTAGSRATVPARRRRGAYFATPFNGLAWAATVVFAVGLGWLLHDTVEQPERVAVSELPDAPSSSAAQRTASQEATAADRMLEQGAVTTGAAPTEAAPTEAARNEVPPTEVPPHAAESFAGEAAPARAVSAGDEYAVAEEGAAPLRQAPSPALSPPPPPAAAPQPESRVADYDVADAAPVGAASGAGVRDAATPPAVSAVPTPADGWRASTPAEAARLAGELVRLDRAEVVAAATRGAVPLVEVRTVQMTERGEMLLVVQRPRGAARLQSAQRREAERSDAAAAAEASALESDSPAITVQIDDWTVTISGAVARDRLEQLAEGLR